MILESGRSPGEENGNQLHPVFLPGEFHGQRTLAGYSSWGHKSWIRLESKPPTMQNQPTKVQSKQFMNVTTMRKHAAMIYHGL